MTASDIIRCIDDGANHYISLLGEAAHMERHDNGCYSYMCILEQGSKAFSSCMISVWKAWMQHSSRP